VRPSKTKQRLARSKEWYRPITFDLPPIDTIPTTSVVHIVLERSDDATARHFKVPDQKMDLQMRHCCFGFRDGLDEMIMSLQYQKGHPPNPLGYGPLKVLVVEANNKVIARSSNSIYLNTGTKQSRKARSGCSTVAKDEQNSTATSPLSNSQLNTPFQFLPPGSPTLVMTTPYSTTNVVLVVPSNAFLVMPTFALPECLPYSGTSTPNELSTPERMLSVITPQEQSQLQLSDQIHEQDPIAWKSFDPYEFLDPGIPLLPSND